MEIMRLVSQRQTIILSSTIDGLSGSILKYKSDHSMSKDVDGAQKGGEPKDETQSSESKRTRRQCPKKLHKRQLLIMLA